MQSLALTLDVEKCAILGPCLIVYVCSRSLGVSRRVSSSLDGETKISNRSSPRVSVHISPHLDVATLCALAAEVRKNTQWMEKHAGATSQTVANFVRPAQYYLYLGHFCMLHFFIVYSLQILKVQRYSWPDFWARFEMSYVAASQKQCH